MRETPLRVRSPTFHRHLQCGWVSDQEKRRLRLLDHDHKPLPRIPATAPCSNLASYRLPSLSPSLSAVEANIPLQCPSVRCRLSTKQRLQEKSGTRESSTRATSSARAEVCSLKIDTKVLRDAFFVSTCCETLKQQRDQRSTSPRHRTPPIVLTTHCSSTGWGCKPARNHCRLYATTFH